VAGLYTALSGPGGASYYDPLTGVGMARDQADSANEYSDNLNSLEPALHRAFVDVTGLLPGPIGSAGAGLIDGEITYIETGNAKEALVRGGTTAGIGLAFGKAGHLLGGPLSSALASRVSEEAAPVVAGAVSDLARKGNCFIAGTPVQMADGSTKPIEQVKVGDFVKSRNPKTGVTEAKRVTETFTHIAPQVLTLTLSDPKTGLPAERIVCTPGHPFYVNGKGFVLAGDLGIGTSIVTRAGPCLSVSGRLWHEDAADQALPERVFNFTVQDDHTYFVGTAGGGAWVHNDSLPLRIDPNGYADARSAELQLSVPAKQRGRINMSAGVLEDPTTGARIVVVGTSEGNGYLRNGVTLKAGEILATGPAGRHAERDIIFYAQRNRLRVIAIGAGLRHCTNCQDAIEGVGGVVASRRAPRK